MPVIVTYLVLEVLDISYTCKDDRPSNGVRYLVAMLEPMAVAVHAIRQAKLLDGTGMDSNILVCGLGTIGLLVAMFLRDAGNKNVFCIGNKDIQRQKLLGMGYVEDSFCDARTVDPDVFVMDMTDGKGADFYFECIGRSENYSQAVRLTSALGSVVLVGNPEGDMELNRNTYWNILRKQMTLKGTWNSSFTGINTVSDTGVPADDWRYVISRLSAIHGGGKRLSGFVPADLITHRFSLSDMDKGLAIMRDKSEEYIKIMVQVC